MTHGQPIGVAIGRLAAHAPDAAMVTDHRRSVTRSELERRTNQLARAFAEQGVGRGDYVTIGLGNSVDFLEATVAAWKLGAVPQPISARLPRREREAIVDLVDPALMVGVAPDEAGARPVLPALPDLHQSTEPLPPAVSPSVKAPTSGGSTGRPKVIVSTQPGVAESLTSFGTLLRMTEGGVHLTTGPYYHNGPFLTAACALLLGCHVVVMPRFDAAAALRLVEEHRVDWMYSVPTMLQRIWRLPDDDRLGPDLSSLRTVLHLGAPCPPWLKRAWIDWLGPDRLLELYAATEVQAATLIDGREWLEHPGSVGRPVIGEIVALDPDGAKVPPGEVGELWMRRGPGLGGPYRYLGAEPRAREDSWESVGDLGSIDADGYVHLADRDGDLILVGGANVYPAEVEAALDEHPAVRSSCVIGLPDEDLGAVPHALVELAEDVPEDQLLAHLRERLSSAKLPRSFERSATPLRDDAGKVRRPALRAERLRSAG